MSLSVKQYCQLADICLDRAEQTVDPLETQLMQAMAEVLLKLATGQLAGQGEVLLPLSTMLH